jgi:hypothetical protein
MERLGLYTTHMNGMNGEKRGRQMGKGRRRRSKGSLIFLCT